MALPAATRTVRQGRRLYPNLKTPARHCSARLSKQTQPAKTAQSCSAVSFQAPCIGKKQMGFIGEAVKQILDWRVAGKPHPERFSAARSRACVRACLSVQTGKQGSDCTTCETEHPTRVSVWSACGRLSVAMEILGTAFLQEEAGEQLHSTTWGFLRFGSDSRAGFSLILLHTCQSPASPRIPTPVFLHSPLLSFFPLCIGWNFRSLVSFLAATRAADRTFTHL